MRKSEIKELYRSFKEINQASSISYISAQVDSLDKTAFDSFCKDVGISSSAAINMFIKAVLREHRIPFLINNDPFYSESNMEFLREGIQALNSGN